MKVWVYSIMRDEHALIEYWLRHYSTFCDRLIIYDQGSTDGTPELAEHAGADVRVYPGPDAIDDGASVAFARQTLVEARDLVDWVIWVDADEFIYHPNIRQRLGELSAAGVTLPRTRGYQMLAEAPPSSNRQIYAELPNGVVDHRFDKRCILHPSLDIEWGVGKHNVEHVHAGTVIEDQSGDPLKLLHYRWLGRAYFEARNARNWSRLSARNRNNNWGTEVGSEWTGDYSVQWFEALIPQARAVV